MDRWWEKVLQSFHVILVNGTTETVSSWYFFVFVIREDGILYKRTRGRMLIVRFKYYIQFIINIFAQLFRLIMEMSWNLGWSW